MINNLKPYPAMKDSGVPWLGEVPEHWSERRAKYFYREADERSVLGDEELLSVSHKTGVTPRKQSVTMFLAESTVGYKICRPGDIAINTMWAFMGALGVARQVGIVSPAYGVYRPQKTDAPNPEYLDRLLRLDAYKSEYTCRSTGINSSRLRLYPDEFLRIPIICPPPAEQSAIVRFLNHVDHKIRRYIRAKQKLIKLLEEQKQAIIHRAVTRGLDPDVRLKASGVEWLGEIPEHWEIRRAKAVCSVIVDCKNRTPDAIEGGGFLVVRTTCVRDGKFDASGGYTTDAGNFRIWTSRGAPQLGDVFFTREAPAGEACLVPDQADLCMGQRMMYFRPDPDLLDPEFLLLNIYGPLTRTYIELETNGSTVGHLRLGQVYSLPLVWCPIEEQRAIVAHVHAESQSLEQAQASAKQEITLLHEYRTRLIVDVVTGKLDVREAATGLPEEVMEEEFGADELDEDLELEEGGIDLDDIEDA